ADLAALVLSNRLAVSSAEELLTLPSHLKRALAERAVDEAWEHAQVRAAVRQQRRTARENSRGLSGDIRLLRQRLRSVRPDSLTAAQRRDLRLLFEDLAPIARAPSGPRSVVLPQVPVVTVRQVAPRSSADKPVSARVAVGLDKASCDNLA